MSMNLGDNFSKQNKKPNFEGDHFTTLEEMKNYSEDFNPPMRVVTCEATDAPDNRGIYLYDETNEVNEQTGKYKKAGGGSGGGITGELKWFVGRNADFDGWLLCDGRELNKSDYPVLAAALGTSFGIPTDSSKFKLPDPRGKVVGVCNGTHILGTDVGTETKTIAKENLPNYNLSCSSAGNHSHITNSLKLGMTASPPVGSVCMPVLRSINSDYYDGKYNNFRVYNDSGSYITNSDADWLPYSSENKTSSTTGSHTHTISLGGGGQAFNVMQPTLFIGNLFIHI